MLLFAETNQYIWLAVLLGLLVLFFVYISIKSKKDESKMKEMLSSLEKGDKVITNVGVIGKIVEIEERDGLKVVTIETGTNKNKGYLSIDERAVYMVIDKFNKPVEKQEEPKVEPTEIKEIAENENAEPVLDEKIDTEEPKEEPKPKTKNKKKSKK